MTGVELDLKLSAKISEDMYLLGDNIGLSLFKARYKDRFQFEEESFQTVRTGALIIIKKPSTMLVLAKGTGAHEQEAFITFKGTSSLYDALTDLNAGIKTSHTGTPIHQGFYYAFDSVLHDLKKFIGELKGVSMIHCLGHSLGGALASLAADWIRARSSLPVKLYTFGSPRVGLDMFARKCTSRLSSNNIYRAYHRTDPVAMVPTWPFTHIPTRDVDYRIQSPVAAIPWEYHKIKRYVDSADSAGSWEVLKNNRPLGYLDSTIEKWLESDGLVSFSARSLELVNAALMYVCKKVLHATGIALVVAGATTLTLMDRLAIFLHKAVEVSSDVSSWVFHLVKKMASLIGIMVVEGTSLTVSFMRAVFLRLQQRIASMVQSAGRDLR